eukprot:m.242661 g.242661  ORF g.242661 m.242661 type:complete len:491 (-) comp25987_c0_seq1:36-1508(-)
MIVDGAQVVLRAGRSVRVCAVRVGSNVKIGKLSFKLDNLIGKCFGSKFEVVDKNLVPISPEADPAVAEEDVGEAAEDNRNLVSSREHQALSTEEVLRMKKDGIRGEDLVDKLVENSVTFKGKTVYAQEKYIRKKIRKHAAIVVAEPPSVFNVLEMLALKNSGKTNLLRGDTIAMMLLRANVHAGQRVIVADTCHGIVAAAAAERLGGHGSIVHVHSGEMSTSAGVEAFGFSPAIRATLSTYPIEQLAAVVSPAEPTPAPTGASDPAPAAAAPLLDPAPATTATGASEALPAAATAAGTGETAMDVCEKQASPAEVVESSTRDGAAGRALAAAAEEDQNAEAEDDEEETGKTRGRRPPREGDEQARQARRELRERTKALLMEANFDSLLIATRFHPWELLEGLMPLLRPSAAFAIYSPTIEPLTDCFSRLRGTAVNLQITENFLREYQVLPDRTHPHMSMNGASGYILSGTVVSNEHEIAKRARIEAGPAS